MRADSRIQAEWDSVVDVDEILNGSKGAQFYQYLISAYLQPSKNGCQKHTSRFVSLPQPSPLHPQSRRR